MCVCVCVRLKWSRNCSEMGRGRSLGTDASEDPDLSWWYLSWPHWHVFSPYFSIVNLLFMSLTLFISVPSFTAAKPRTDMAMACMKKAWVTGWNLCLLDPFSSVFDLWLNLGWWILRRNNMTTIVSEESNYTLDGGNSLAFVWTHVYICVCVRVRLHWMRADGRCKLQPESRTFLLEQSRINGHSRILNWRYLPYISPI